MEAIQHELPGDRVLVRLYTVGVDFEFAFTEQEALFLANGLSAGGALLVRPDQHIIGSLLAGTIADEAVKLILNELGL